VTAEPAREPAGPARSPPPEDVAERAFSRRTAVLLAIVGVVSLLATILLPLLGDDDPGHTRGANAYSKSPIGHHAFVRLLRDLDVPVVVSRHRSAHKVGYDDVLLLAVPDAYEETELEEAIVVALDRGASVLVVLPKWDTRAWDSRRDLDPDDDRRRGPFAPRHEAAEVLEVVWSALTRYVGGRAPPREVLEDAIIRDFQPPAGGWQGVFHLGEGAALPRYQGLAEATAGLLSVVWHDDDRAGSLIAAFDEAELYIVSDPDLINTSGLGAGDHAVLMYRFIADYLGAGAVVVDEVIHGFKKPDSIWQELFSYPLVLLTVHLIALLALALWAALGRFGRPVAPPPRVAPGKATLIDNTATLLALGGHVRYGLAEYLRANVRALARAYALSPRLDDDERLLALARLGRQRGVSVDLEHVAARALTVRDRKSHGPRAVALARKIYRFRLEMLDGHRIHS